MVEVDLHETVEGGGGGVPIEHDLPHHLRAAKVQRLRGEGDGRETGNRKETKKVGGGRK